MLNRPTRSLRRIAGSTSAIALATALIVPAHAQSINAPAPTVVSGSATYNTTGTVDTITINSNTAVLDFTPNDTATGGGAINFQNAGTTLRFDRVGQDFTVLSRIVPADPTRAIQFNGNVESRIVSTITNPGGSVWFYSPGGIILGSGATFNVGSLLLSTADPTGGSGVIGSTTSFALSSKADSNYAVTVQSGAQIKALNEGSYVALVAPVVNQNGSVRVNGSAAYVAAEQANLTINQGLFDIDVVVGSDGGGTPLQHLGTTGGPSSTGATGDNHGIFMVAVPKNSAITMLIAPDGNLGFDMAASASIENGAVYLQAGGDLSITSTLAQPDFRIKDLPDPTLAATISLSGGNPSGTTITSVLVAQASKDAVVQSNAGNVLTGFDSRAYIFAGGTASLTNSSGTAFTAKDVVSIQAFGATPGQANVLAQAGSSMAFNGDLSVVAAPYLRTAPPGFDATSGGNAFVQADGAGASITAGLVQVFSSPDVVVATTGGTSRILATNGGALTMGLAAIDSSGNSDGIGNVGTGGVAELAIDGGVVNISSDLVILAVSEGGNGGSAVAGTARLLTGAQGGLLTVGGATTISASAETFSVSGPVAAATAGVAAVDLSAVNVGKSTSVSLNSLTVEARALGGDPSGGSFSGGGANGGTARINANKGVSLNATGALDLLASAKGGLGAPGGFGGSATGGTAQVNAAGGAISFTNASISAGATGGGGGDGPVPSTAGGAGGLAVAGGGISLNADNAGSITGKSVSLLAEANGGAGGDGFSATDLAGSGGAATASPINLNVDTGGTITLTTVTANARGSGGNTGVGIGNSGTAGGAAKGGALTIGVGAGGLIELADVDAPLDGFSGNGFAGGSDAGNAVGGSASIFTQAGGTFRVTTGELSIDTTGDAGSNNGGGDLTGGDAVAGNINIGGLGALEILGSDLTLNASAFGGGYNPTTGAGKGGKAVAGAIDLRTSGTLSVSGPTVLFALAEGGATAALSGGAGGDAFGGKAFLTSSKGAGSFTGAVFLDTSADGGAGAGSSAGGVGVGGRSRIATEAFTGTGSGPSTLSFAGAVSLLAGGDGGSSATGVGGAGYAGQAPVIGVFPDERGIEIHTLGGGMTFSKAVSISAEGNGGNGATGGLGKGGRANLIAFGGDISVAQSLFGTARGFGGSSSVGVGGAGTGGNIQVQLQDGGFSVPVGTPGTVTLGSLTFSAEGRGGNGQAGGGAGTGGIASAQPLATQHVMTINGFVTLDAQGTGGASLGSGAGAGGLGQGGQAVIGTQGGAATLADSVLLRADGFGGSVGSGATGNGGAGTGGTASYFANKGTVAQAAGGITVSAEGFGGLAGSAGAGGTGGLGTGGNASIRAFNGGTVDSKATFVSLDASGDGGSIAGTGNGTGGLGTGGAARVIANGGTITLRSDVSVIADGGGGFGSGTGNGGAGIGGEARLGTEIASPASTLVTVTGRVDLDASAFGGAGGFVSGTGGAGNGGIPADPNNGPFNKGAYLAATGGTVTVGSADLDASGTGGDGALAGGAGNGGYAEIYFASATLDAPGLVTIDSTGTGGDGFSTTGGKGGLGTGGLSFVTAASGGFFGTATNATSRITIGTLFQVAAGEGGRGGDGAVGAAGGRGGDGIAGRINTIAQAGGGTLEVTSATLFIQGAGGDGGSGGAAGTTGPGGDGGRGGDGTGGFTNFGTVSGPDTPINAGSATFGDATVFLLGIGGSGGDGTSGGKGGDGGTAFGGSGAILSRGAPVTIGTMSLDAGAFGGQGGDGSVVGLGGNAEAGAARLLASNRFNRTERGSIIGGTYSGSAFPLGGLGSTNGTTVAGQVFAEVTNADVTLDGLFLTSSGDTPPPAGFESYIKVDNGTLEAADLSLSATGNVQLSVINGGVLRANIFSLSSTGSLLPPVAGTPGLIDIGSQFTGFFDGDFISTADVTVAGDYQVTAGGVLTTGNITSGGSVDLSSTGALTTGNIAAGDSISLITEDFLTAGNLTAATGDPASINGFLTLEGSRGVSVGDLKGVSVDIDDGIFNPAVSGIKTGNIVAEIISISSLKDVTLGSVTQQELIPGGSGPTFGVFLSAEGTLSATSIEGLGSVSMFGGQAVKTGAIKAGDSIFIGADGDVTTGDLTAALDPAAIDGSVGIFAFGNVDVGNVTGAEIEFFVGDPTSNPDSTLKTLALKAEAITLDVANTITTGAITTGDFYSGLDPSDGSYLIGIGAVNNVTVGDVNAFTSFGIGSAAAALTVGNVKANDSVMLLGRTGVTTGSIATGTDATDALFVSNTSIIETNPDFAVLQDFSEFGNLFDIAVLRSAAPVRVAGPVTIGGPVTTGSFAAATTGNFQSGAIAAPNRLFLDVGGSIVGGALSTANNLTLSSDQSITVGNLTASSIDLTSKQNVTIGGVAASGTVLVNAGATAAVNGPVSGSSIQITSNDIAIGAGSTLTGSFSITLVSTNAQTRFGGGAGGTGYVLDGTEAQGVRANSIEFRANGGATIGQLALQGSSAGSSANLVGSNGRLQINSGSSGGLVVTGAVTIANATTGSGGNQLTLNGANGIDIVTDQGGEIAMFGSSSSTLGGTIRLLGTNIRVATSSLLGQLGGQTPAQRAQSLAAAPAGSPRPQGYLQANRIEFFADQLLIQNSNTATQFGGFSAGSGGALLRGRSSSQADAIIFGRIADGSGSFKINAEAVPLLTLTDGEGAPSTVTATSLFNNCPFTGACGTPPPPPPPDEEEETQDPIIDRIPAVIQAALTSAMSSVSDPETIAAVPTINLVTTIDTGPLRTEPVISDPVTGGGNPSLWETPAIGDGDDDDRERRTPGQGGEQ